MIPDALWDELRWRTLRREKLTTWVFAQDVCRLLARLVLEEAQNLTLAELAVALGKPESLVLRRVTLLRERGLMEPESFRLCFYQRPQPPVQAAPEPAYQSHQPRPLYPSDRNRAARNGYQRTAVSQGETLRNDSANDSAQHSAQTPQTPVAESSLARDVVVVSEFDSKSKTTTNNNNRGEEVQEEREAEAAALAESFVEPGNEAAALLEMLRSQGVIRHVAEELVRDCPAEVIKNQIAWLRERENAGSVKNLAGMLVDSIRRNWDPPPSVVRRQEAREKRERAEAERRRESDAAAERQREADRLWERMSPTARKRIETELRARLPSPLDRFAAKDPDHPSVREWMDTERRARLLKEMESAKP